MIDELPTVLTEKQNKKILRIPTGDKIRGVIMGLNRNSTGGPDGMTSAFYQDAWEIIQKDIQNMVKAFFYRYQLPRFITHTNLVLLPKM